MKEVASYLSCSLYWVSLKCNNWLKIYQKASGS